MAQKLIEIYTWSSCPFCQRAKALLDRKGYQYTEYSLDGDEPGRAKMAERANGRRSVPQIFVGGDYHVGGCDDLHGLEAGGGLEKLVEE